MTSNPTKASVSGLRTAAAGSTLRILNFAVSLAVAFLLTPLAVDSLGDRTYGFWLFVLALTGYLGLFDLGLGTAVSRHIAGALGRGDRADCQRIFSTALQFYPLLGGLVLLATCASPALAPLLTSDPQEAGVFSTVMLILGFGTAVSLMLQPYFGAIQALGRYDVLATVEVLTLCLRSVLTVGALRAGYGVLTIAWITFLGGAFRLVLGVYLSRRLLPWLRYAQQPFHSTTTKALFGYSFYMMIAKVADNARFNTDSLVITAFLGLSYVTPFGIAASLTNKFRDLMMSLLGVLQPVYSRLDGEGDLDRIKQTLFFATKVSMCVSTLMAFGLIAWGRPFIERWMGPAYASSYPCLVVLAIGWTIQFWQSPGVSLMYATSRHKSYAFTNTLEAAANILLSLWWVRPLGIIGVALGTALPMIVVRLLLQPYYVCKILDIDVAEYRSALLGNVWRILVALAAPLTFALLVRPESYLELGGVGIAAALLYAPVIWFLVFTSSERTSLTGLLPTRRGAPTDTAAA